MEEAKQAVQQLSDALGFQMTEEEVNEQLEDMDTDGDGDVTFEEFDAWWKSVSKSKKEKKLLKQEQLSAAGFLEESPKPKMLQATLKCIMELLPSIGLNQRAFATLEDMCINDQTYDLLQGCYNLCELKRMTIKAKDAIGAVYGLEALNLVPKLLEGNEKLGIAPNKPAQETLQKIIKGDKEALGALEYLKQGEFARIMGMMTQRQRRAAQVIVIGGGLPVMMAMDMISTADLMNAVLSGLYVDYGNSTGSWSGSGSWEMTYPEPMPEPEPLPEPEPEPYDRSKAEGHTSPSFYIIGLMPMVTTICPRPPGAVKRP